MSSFRVKLATQCLWTGGILAYPTEAVWGLGCDPFNATACLNLLQIKGRPVEKGMILIAADVQQIGPLLAPLKAEQREQLLQSWPGPTTWLIPDSEDLIPWWIRGEHSSVAVRVSSHPLVRELCLSFGGPIVSTSANKAGQRPAKTRVQIARSLQNEIHFVLNGKLGAEAQPSTIKDLVTGAVLR